MLIVEITIRNNNYDFNNSNKNNNEKFYKFLSFCAHFSSVMS